MVSVASQVEVGDWQIANALIEFINIITGRVDREETISSMAETILSIVGMAFVNN